MAVIGPAASAAATDAGGGSSYVNAPFSVTPLQGIQAAAAGHHDHLRPGPARDTALPQIPAQRADPGQQRPGRDADGPGDGHVRAGPAGRMPSAALSLDGQVILSVPGTPPVSTYSVGVNLPGQTYTLQLSGGASSAALRWATPSELAPGIAQAVAAAKSARVAVVVVSDDTESEAADRASLNLPSAQNELISAVAAANPHTVVVVDAGAPVVMPWLDQVASVVDAWYPGESNGTALAAVLFGQTDPSGHLPVTFPGSLSQVPASSPSEFPGENGEVLYSEGIDVGYRYYDASNETPMFPFGYGLSYTSFRYSHLTVTPQPVHNHTSDPAPTSCGCNGQSGNLVTVSATLTNTGKVAGSDVAQLYLGDPAVAGSRRGSSRGSRRSRCSPASPPPSTSP